MKKTRHAVITGSGSYIPTRLIPNSHFLNHRFYDASGILLQKANEEIIRQFQDITGIAERRYTTDNLVASDLAFFAAQDALESSGSDPESFDYIIVAHNFGDIRPDTYRSEFVPTLASRVKQKLGIKNPKTIAYDLPFGCAGWLQGVIQADFYIQNGAEKILVIGTETLSRICDPHDRDSMIYADGAGATIIEAVNSDEQMGITAHSTHTYADELAYVLRMDKSANPGFAGDRLFLKMNGRKLYEHALTYVPGVIKECMDKAGLCLCDITKLLIHQANAKMDEAILKQVYKMYNVPAPQKSIMPMTIAELGNTSVATIPTLYDLIAKGRINHHSFEEGSTLLFASVGAGVNINAVTYKIPAGL